MKLYIYAKSGHSYGLDRVKRACAIYDELKEFDPILCTTDFRAGGFAKDVFGVRKSVSVDLIENLPNIMERGDILIFDSDEPSEFMKENMHEFCSVLFEVGIDIPKTITHSIFNQKSENKKALFFFGDDDYKEIFMDCLATCKDLELDVLLGHYYFLGNEDFITSKFHKAFEDIEYCEAICEYEYLLSGSVQAAIECLVCGNKPVFFIRTDKLESEEIDFDLLKAYNIPIASYNNFDDLITNFKEICSNYPQLTKYDKFDFSDIKSIIFKNLIK